MTSPALFGRLFHEERQCSWWAEDPASGIVMVTTVLRDHGWESRPGTWTRRGLEAAASRPHSRERFHKELVASQSFTAGKYSNLDCRNWFCQKCENGPNDTGNETLEKADRLSFSHRQSVTISKKGHSRAILLANAQKRKKGKQAHASVLLDRDPELKSLN